MYVITLVDSYLPTFLATYADYNQASYSMQQLGDVGSLSVLGQYLC